MPPPTTTATATTATTTTTTNSSAGSPLAERVADRGLGGVLDCRDGRSKLPTYHCMSRAPTAVSARRAVIPQPDDNDHDDLPPADNPWSFFFFSTHLGPPSGTVCLERAHNSYAPSPLPSYARPPPPSLHCAPRSSYASNPRPPPHQRLLHQHQRRQPYASRCLRQPRVPPKQQPPRPADGRLRGRRNPDTELLSRTPSISYRRTQHCGTLRSPCPVSVQSCVDHGRAFVSCTPQSGAATARRRNHAAAMRSAHELRIDSQPRGAGSSTTSRHARPAARVAAIPLMMRQSTPSTCPCLPLSTPRTRPCSPHRLPRPPAIRR